MRLRADRQMAVSELIIISTGLILLVALLLTSRQVVRLAEWAFSPDHTLTPTGQRELLSSGYFLALSLMGLGAGLRLARHPARRDKVRRLFLSDPLCLAGSGRVSSGWMFVASTAAGLLLSAAMLFANRDPALYAFLYAKDRGLLDLFVPTLAFISAVLLGAVVIRLWKARGWSWLPLGYLVILAAFVFDAGEETSWGQDFFRWRTPALFAANLEHQTNVHNYFNPYFDYGYVSLSLLLLVVLISAWMEYNQVGLALSRPFLPHPSLIGLALLIAYCAVVWFPEQELLEELVAVFVLFYTVRIFRCLKPTD